MDLNEQTAPETEQTAPEAEQQATPEAPQTPEAARPEAEQPAQPEAQPESPQPETEQPEAEQPEAAPAPDPALIDAELRAAAALAGVPKEKLRYVAKLADLSGEGTLTERAERAVAQVLKDVPELLGQGAQVGSKGNFRREPPDEAERYREAVAAAINR